MKKLMTMVVLTLAAASIAFGQTQDKKMDISGYQPGNVAHAVMQLDSQLNEAGKRHDTALFERTATDDYISVNPAGVVANKAQAIASAKNFKFESLHIDDVKVRVYGDSAVLTARATLKAQFGDQDISGQYRYLRVYVKRNGQWQLASFQVTRIAQP